MPQSSRRLWPLARIPRRCSGFPNQPATVDIKVSGLMAGARGAVAILSLNEGPPRSFRVGESLAQGVRLAAIEGDAVVIERGTQHTRIKVSTLPDWWCYRA
ncbi:Type IV pilus biogenesis [Pseudomonas marginalis]|nr:Type IV pilus biogenesis [Pseudomonas marginalis]